MKLFLIWQKNIRFTLPIQQLSFFEEQTSNLSQPVILPPPLKLKLNQPKNLKEKIKTIYFTKKKSLGDMLLGKNSKG